jgi:hypothetical protein
MVVVQLTFDFPLIITSFKFVVPDTLKDDNKVDALETSKLLKLVH